MEGKNDIPDSLAIYDEVFELRDALVKAARLTGASDEVINAIADILLDNLLIAKPPVLLIEQYGGSLYYELRKE